jgi:endonuclease/exonuclease/phosphatase family metal-dependent hydrolase
LDLVRVNPYLCRDNRACPELGKPLSVRWDELQVALSALHRREQAAKSSQIIPAKFVVDQSGQGHELTVMVYNIKGLPDTFRGGVHPDAFRIIGERLAARRKAGTAPDIVLLQEVFTDRAREIARYAGYKHVVLGPARQSTRTYWLARPFVYLWKAAWNRSIHLESSGLMILTDLDVQTPQEVSFGHRACAGSDCFANKGLVAVRVKLPDSNRWIDVLDTHLNSNASSDAGIKQILFAHERQVDKIHDVITAERKDQDALILGGDFNSNPETVRYAYLEDRLGLKDANSDCLIQTGCTIPQSVDLQAFWRSNELRQFYRQGSSTELQPIRATMDFTVPVDGKPLSDHDAIEITYLVRNTSATD